MSREVYSEVSKVSRAGQRGGDAITLLAQHWRVVVGKWTYDAASDIGQQTWTEKKRGYNTARRVPTTASLDGRQLVGKTDKTDDEIKCFIDRWNRNATKYHVVFNNCQQFAARLCDDLCGAGRHKLPPPAGTRADKDRVDLGVGEVAAAKVFGCSTALRGPGVHVGPSDAMGSGAAGRIELGSVPVDIGGVVQGGLAGPSAHFALGQNGAFFGAETSRAELRAETPLGHVGVAFAPNLDTGIGSRDGRNVEANLLGFGGRLGRDGVQVNTPAGSVACSLM